MGRVAYTYLELRRVNSLLTHKRDQALPTSGDVCRFVKREIVQGLVHWLFSLFHDSQSVNTACLLLGI